MTPLPQCSDLAQQGYSLGAINVIQASEKCADDTEISLQATPARNELTIGDIPLDPLVLVGFLIGGALAFGSNILNLLGISIGGGR